MQLPLITEPEDQRGGESLRDAVSQESRLGDGGGNPGGLWVRAWCLDHTQAGGSTSWHCCGEDLQQPGPRDFQRCRPSSLLQAVFTVVIMRRVSLAVPAPRVADDFWAACRN